MTRELTAGAMRLHLWHGHHVGMGGTKACGYGRYRRKQEKRLGIAVAVIDV